MACNTTEVIPTPVGGNGLIFAAGGSWSANKPTMAIRPGGSGDATETHLVWRLERHSLFLSSPVLHNGILVSLVPRSTTGYKRSSLRDAIAFVSGILGI